MMYVSLFFVFFFFKQKTAYDMRISDWSSDVCAEDQQELVRRHSLHFGNRDRCGLALHLFGKHLMGTGTELGRVRGLGSARSGSHHWLHQRITARSEEHTYELQSLMRIPYAVFCLKKTKKK